MKGNVTKKLTTSSLLILSALGLSACMPKAQDSVICKGVQTVDGKPIYTDKGTCKKLAGAKPKLIKCQQWETTDKAFVCKDPKVTIPRYGADSYVKCYGVAAASMNDCGTSTTACGGSISVAKSKEAWIAIPKGICQKIKGAKIELPGQGD